ncbi:unnamed protein product [Brassica napus]|uniref:(rape) hypothetical protein n=1 Tax=Brassica napus TaxID=3708 RepID=A0A817B545_BRANA|nr:unnamed protein product [Brassica napus]
MVNTIHIELRSGLLVASVSAYCWFISISSRSFLLTVQFDFCIAGFMFQWQLPIFYCIWLWFWY